MTQLVIKVAGTELVTSMDNLVEVSESADGMVFDFKGGLSLIFTESYMPSSTKQVVINTIEKIKGKKIIVELDNPKQTVLVVND